MSKILWVCDMVYLWGIKSTRINSWGLFWELSYDYERYKEC